MITTQKSTIDLPQFVQGEDKIFLKPSPRNWGSNNKVDAFRAKLRKNIETPEHVTPLKIDMEHNSLEVWKIIFLSKWVMAVGSSR